VSLQRFAVPPGGGLPAVPVDGVEDELHGTQEAPAPVGDLHTTISLSQPAGTIEAGVYASTWTMPALFGKVHWLSTFACTDRLRTSTCVPAKTRACTHHPACVPDLAGTKEVTVTVSFLAHLAYASRNRK
jgi:hypothetical protein